MTIQLLYFDGCPGYEELRPRLERLLDERGLRDRLELTPIRSTEEAQADRFLGSPSVRVDGRDVEPSARARDDFGLKCRIYDGPGGLVRTPPDALIRAALDEVK